MNNDPNDVAGYTTCAILRVVFRQEGLGDMSKMTFWRWVKKTQIPTKKAGRTLMVPALLALELRKRELGRA